MNDMSTVRLPFTNEISVEYPHDTVETPRFRHHVRDELGDHQAEAEKLLVTSDTPVSIPQIPRKRRPLSLLCCFLYAFILIFCWSITAILCVRPIKGSGWHDTYTYIGPCTYSEGGMAQGFSCDGWENILTRSQLAVNDRWRRTVRVLGTVMSVAAIPVSSALCARGAVAYIQNRYPDDFPFSKVIPLADRGWLNPTIMGGALFARDRRKYLSWYLIVSLCICGFGTLIWPLQELLLTQKSVQLLVVEHAGAPDPSSYVPDADIAALSQVNSAYAIGATRAAINMAEYWDSQPNIWRDPENTCNQTSTWSSSCTRPRPEGGTFLWPLLGNSTFVSNLASTLNTGLAVNHAFRFNSTVDCVTVEESAYPPTCSGFTTSTRINTDPESTEDQIFKVCVPGAMDKFPWNVTRNRQDISEELYFHFNTAAVSSFSNASSSFTRRCTANTTAGYFQLPNNLNSTFGPLLEEFDLALSDDSQMAFPPEGTGSDHYPPERLLGHAYPIPDPPETPALGPLLTAALSLFGPSTFFSTRANTSGTDNTPAHNNASITPENCTDTIPLYYIATRTFATSSEEPRRLRRCASTSESAYNSDLRAWLNGMFLVDASDNYRLRARDAFTQAVFFANKVNLAQAAAIPDYRRIIPLDEGVQVERLFMSTAGIAVLSVIIGLHSLGLIWVSIYSAWVPTWTEVLDALAVARLRVE